MSYSFYREPKTSRTVQSAFYGLNLAKRPRDGELCAMQNLTSDLTPCLSPRGKRLFVRHEVPSDGEGTPRLNGILGEVGFAAVYGCYLYYLGERVEGIILRDSEKNMLAMGGCILIYPDAVYYNTVNGECGSLDEMSEEVSGTTRLLRVKIGGSLYSPGNELNLSVAYAAGSASAKDSIKATLGVYRECSELPSSVEYTPIAFSNINIYLVKYDGMLYYPYAATVNRVSDYTQSIEDITEWRTLDISTVEIAADYAPEALAASDTALWSGNVHIRYSYKDASTPYYLMDTGGRIFDYFTSLRHISGGSNMIYADYEWVRRTVPVLDFVCVHENRLWGCHYGTQVNTYESINELYCSALGDFKRWTLSSETAVTAGDPYTAGVGDYGPFTGCVSHRGYVLFFKEDVIYRVSGTRPSNFTVSRISTLGIQRGCERSAQIIDEVLYYKSKNGIYAYDGALPQRVSGALGDGYYKEAVAGSLFSKYYVSMVKDGRRMLYVFDTRYGVWHAEDGIDVRFFCEYDGGLYAAAGNDIVLISGTPSPIFTEVREEGEVYFTAETGDIGLASPYQKYFCRLLIRMELGKNAHVKAELICDGGEPITVCDFTSPQGQSFLMPVITPRCDRMRVRLSGSGSVCIYSLSYETENASLN